MLGASTGASRLLEQGQGTLEERAFPRPLFDDGEVVGAGRVQDVDGTASVVLPVGQSLNLARKFGAIQTARGGDGLVVYQLWPLYDPWTVVPEVLCQEA